jgi:hypothetical protein
MRLATPSDGVDARQSQFRAAINPKTQLSDLKHGPVWTSNSN